MENKIIIFEDKKIKRTWFKDEWYYSLVEIVEILTNSVNLTYYFKKICKKNLELGKYIGTNCPHIEMLTKTGKNRQTLSGNTKNVFSSIQSVLTLKAEQFKQWLAQLGHDRIKEIENHELAQDRVKLEKKLSQKIII